MSCKIYFIQCLETNEIYIGSTKRTLERRMYDHKSRMNCSSKIILERGNYIYDILEEVEECDRYEREQYYMDKTECINKLRTPGSGRDIDKRKEYLKEYSRQYNILNKDKISKSRSQKYTCECGNVLSLRNKSTHLKTKKHQNFIRSSHYIQTPL